MSSKLTDNRRENVRALVELRGGVSKLSRALGYKNPSFISQMAGPEPTRDITEKTARRIEQVLNLPMGSLDLPPGSKPQASATAAPLDNTTALVADVIRTVSRMCEDEGLSTPPSKFGDLVILALNDAMEHGGQPRPDHARLLVRLLK